VQLGGSKKRTTVRRVGKNPRRGRRSVEGPELSGKRVATLLEFFSRGKQDKVLRSSLRKDSKSSLI